MRILLLLILSVSFQTVFAKENCNLPFELSTRGHLIIDQCGNKVMLKGVNWFGAHEITEVPGGLDKQPLSKIVVLIKQGGFNSVRFTFSNEMLHDSKPVAADLVAANPELLNKTPLEIFDASVKALTDAGLIVILNNHTTTSEWCCAFDFNGLWHHPDFQTTAEWINDWEMMASRYQNNPLVAGMDLRNEVRTGRYLQSRLPVYPNWGSGDANDWKLAATQAGNAIHEVNPKLLIVVEGINWYGTPMWDGYRPMLTPVKNKPIVLNHSNKLVYEEHVYAYTGPEHTGENNSSIGKTRFRDMSEATLRATLDKKFGFVLEEGHAYTAPVWLGEFGVSGDQVVLKDKTWFKYFTTYLIDKEIGWAFWALNPIRASGMNEPFGLLNDDWSDYQYKQDWRAADIDRLLHQ